MPEPSIQCSTCEVGLCTIYAPTLAVAPDQVCAQRQKIVKARAHQVICRAGERGDLVYTIYSGWACRAMQFPDGRRQILAFLLPGDTINVEAVVTADYAPPFSVRALTDITMCAFKAEAVHDIIFSNDAQRRRFASYIISQMSLTDQRLADLGQRRAVGRIAQLVLDLESTLRARGLIAGDTFEFPLRQEDLGDALGLTASHVNRTLVALRQSGVLELRQGKLQLLDRQALADIAAKY